MGVRVTARAGSLAVGGRQSTPASDAAEPELPQPTDWAKGLWVLSVMVCAGAAATVGWLMSPPPSLHLDPDFLPPILAGKAKPITEWRDRATFLGVGLTAGIAVLLAGRATMWATQRRAAVQQPWRGTSLVVAVVLTGWLVANSRFTGTLGTGVWWLGFRTPEVILALAGAFALVVWPRVISWTKYLWLPAVPVLGLFLLATIRRPDTLADPVSTSFVIDELLAPAAGHRLLVDYWPQYSTLVGYVPSLMARYLPEQALSLATHWLGVMQVLTLALMAAATMRAASRRYVGLTVLLVSIWALVQELPAVVPIAYPQVFPIRYFLPCALLLVLAGNLTRTPTALAGGVIGGVTLVNNVDWGGGAWAAGTVTVIVIALRTHSPRQAGAWLAGTALGILACWLLMSALAGQAVDLRDILLYARIFGANGFYAVAAPPFGLQWVVAATFVGGAAAGGALLWRAPVGSQQLRLGQVMVYWNLFSLAASLYWFNRSLPPVLQMLLPAWALSVSFTIACLDRTTGWRSSVRTDRLIWLPVLWTFPLAVTGVFHLPNPAAVYRRATQPIPVIALSPTLPAALQVAKSLGNGGPIGLITLNTATEVVRLQDPEVVALNPFNQPDSIFTYGQVDLLCQQLADSGVRVVLLNNRTWSYPKGFYWPLAPGTTPCPGWQLTDNPQLPTGWRLYEPVQQP